MYFVLLKLIVDSISLHRSMLVEIQIFLYLLTNYLALPILEFYPGEICENKNCIIL